MTSTQFVVLAETTYQNNLIMVVALSAFLLLLLFVLGWAIRDDIRNHRKRGKHD